MIAMKFGGSSLESAEAIARLVSIVQLSLDRQPVLVVSAIGQTTDRLLEIIGLAQSDRPSAFRQLHSLYEYHLDLAEKLLFGKRLHTVTALLYDHFANLEIDLGQLQTDRMPSPALLDRIVSYGEGISSHIVAAALNVAAVNSPHLDARLLIVTDDSYTSATPQLPESFERIKRAVDLAGGVPVMGGFIGSTRNGTTTTLGRGGSDLTASIVGVAIDAEEIQFWKSVDGVLTCDPRIFDAPYKLKLISYADAAEMTRCGAKILHPDTVAPAANANIPLLVCNSCQPELDGTRIVSGPVHSTSSVLSIACRVGMTLVEVRPQHQAIDLLFVKNVLSCKSICPELIFTDSGIVYLVHKSGLLSEALISQLDANAEVRVYNEVAVICLICGQSHSASATASRSALLLDDLCWIASAEGSSCGTVSIVVQQSDLADSVRILHEEFFKDPDPSLFVPVGLPSYAPGAEVLV